MQLFIQNHYQNVMISGEQINRKAKQFKAFVIYIYI